MNYDIIVIGAGHGGIEASVITAKMGCKTLLVTMSIDNIGLASCNPAIGGLAKGHLVKELDALGGVMGILTDKSALQYKMLNASKGPAVRGSRAQIDMDEYKKQAKHLILSTSNLEVRQEVVEHLFFDEKGVVRGVHTNIWGDISAEKVILTTGTFLNGLIHIGELKIKSGRMGEPSSQNISEQLKKRGVKVGRLKTGTCPRVSKNSINFDALEIEAGDKIVTPFSFSTCKKMVNQKTYLPCFMTYTNEKTHQIVRDAFHLSPLFNGEIDGVGPRYCPSFEDKINRFGDRNRHHIFVEPMSREANEYYLNGFSTSLPKTVQIKMLHSIKGFQNAHITRFGYAIEYDFVQPTQLHHTLEVKKIANLYCAGQINGTTGYEEAAAQGLIAGINAALSLFKKDSFILRRDEAYIGVLIDDLVTKGTQEPYRMFTSRAEFRLLLRESSATLRLSHYACKFGLLGEDVLQKVQTKKSAINEALNYLGTTFFTNKKENLELLQAHNEQKIADKTHLINIIGRHTMTKEKAVLFAPKLAHYDEEVLEEVIIEAKYNHYISKSQSDLQKMKRNLQAKIPDNFDYDKIISISAEVREKLKLHRPKTLDMASRISGVTPTSLEILKVYLKTHAAFKTLQ